MVSSQELRLPDGRQAVPHPEGIPLGYTYSGTSISTSFLRYGPRRHLRQKAGICKKQYSAIYLS